MQPPVEELAKIARVISKQWLVKVQFVGNKCDTNGKLIRLPALAENASPGMVKLLHGLLDHEVGHVIYTKMYLLKGLSSLEKKLLNCLEDARIECKLQKKYPGCKNSLLHVRKWSFHRMLTQKVKLPTFSQISLWVLSYTTSKLEDDSTELNQLELSLVKDCKDFCRIELGPLIDKEILRLDLTAKIDKDGTQIMVDLAKELAKKIILKDQADSFDKFKVNSESDDDGETDLLAGEVSDAVAESWKEINQSDTQALIKPYLIYSTVDDVVIPMKITGGPALVQSKNRPLYEALRMSLQEETTAWNDKNQTYGRRINAKKLYRLGSAEFNPRIFIRQNTRLGYNTAVSFLIDQSGSMGNSPFRPIGIAFSLVSSVADVLFALGIPFEIIGHTAGSMGLANMQYEGASDVEKECVTRWGNLIIKLYKQFTEPWPAVRNNFTYSGQGLNALDGEALEFTARRLAERKEIKKVLFDIKDGYIQPPLTIGGLHRIHEDYLSRMVEAVEKNNINVVAFGILSREVQRFYKKFIYVPTKDIFEANMVKELQKLLSA